MPLRRLFVGGHHELRRPVHAVDESLMRRIEEAREQLRRQGKEIVPVLGAARPPPKPMPIYMQTAADIEKRA